MVSQIESQNPAETTLKEGKYIYCIIALDEPKTFGPLGIGERGDELHTGTFNGIACVVSNSPIIKYSLSRQNLLLHEKAIEEVMKEYTVLPVRFGTIAQDEDKVKKILEMEYDNFKNLLNKLEGKKELGLKAIFKEDIYNYILERYEDVKVLKEKLQGLPPTSTYYERMEVGKMVEAALDREKEITKSDILANLSPLAVEVRLNNSYGERMIISSAFLIEREREAEFDQKVQEFDAKYGDRINFKYIGTVPPFNFVNLIIETGRY